MVQKDNLDKKLLIICGPTASGKSDLAVEVAKLLDTEIISADSMYIYKKLNVGTAKPTEIEKQGVIHHLIDVCEPYDTFSVGDYKELAKPILENLLNKGKYPIICGGTGFYINSLIYNLSYGHSDKNLEIRNKYLELAKEKGNEYVYNILLEVDKKSAEKLHFNDIKRVVRALEIYESGVLKSELNDTLTPIYNFDCYSLAFSRDILYDRINVRVEKMMDLGLVEEVKNLLDSGVKETDQCMQGIGYKETIEYLKNEINYEQLVEKIKLNSRHYAKRQITFFKKMPNISYLEPKDTKTLAKEIVERL